MTCTWKVARVAVAVPTCMPCHCTTSVSSGALPSTCTYTPPPATSRRSSQKGAMRYEGAAVDGSVEALAVNTVCGAPKAIHPAREMVSGPVWRSPKSQVEKGSVTDVTSLPTSSTRWPVAVMSRKSACVLVSTCSCGKPWRMAPVAAVETSTFCPEMGVGG